MNQMAPVKTGLTAEVAEFVVRTDGSTLSEELVAIGKKSILDGFGLALSGSVARSGALVRRHLDDLSLGEGQATVIGAGRKVAPRFAAFANGVGIHADDYDDTQLAVAKDRVYGLLTHPTAPALPAALAMAPSVPAAQPVRDSAPAVREARLTPALRCRALLQRAQLGEELTPTERKDLRGACVT